MNIGSAPRLLVLVTLLFTLLIAPSITHAAAPVLDATKSPSLGTTITGTVPSGQVGRLVAALVDFASPSGGVDNVTDSDSGAVLGIAIIAKDAALTCFHSTNGGVTWTALGAVSDSNARLLAADSDNRIHCQGSAGTYNDAITFRAWDTSSGIDGGLASSVTNGGNTAFSVASDSASLTVVSGDTTAPTILSVSPDDGDEHVLIDTDIVITFSESIRTNDVEIGLGPCDGVCPVFDVEWSADETIATVTNISRNGNPLPTGTEITLHVYEAPDKAGNDIATEFVSSFTTIAAYVLTTVTPVPSEVDTTSVRYYFTSSGTGSAELHVDDCGFDSEVQATAIGSDQEYIQISGLEHGKTYSCSVYITNEVGAARSVVSNSLTIGPFTVDMEDRSSGGGMRYGCKDPAASNYDKFSASNPKLCRYSPAPAEPEAPAPASLATSSVFMKTLRPGMTDPDVSLLQKFLNAKGFPVAATGPGSSGNETDFFGTLTQLALAKFQEAHAAEILAPLGLTSGTGIFGEATRAFANK